MFTGLIEEVGTVEKIQKNQKSFILWIRCKEVLNNTQIGDSIAVNGICLTVRSMYSAGFMADVMPKTATTSDPSMFISGSKVNLERAMPMNGRFGGHIVSGHIDGIAKVENIVIDENAILYTFSVDEKLGKYIACKGSVAINGISLTVADVKEGRFTVSTIPHTREQTNLKWKEKGDIVNIECDVIAKYVEKLLYGEKLEKAEEEKSKKYSITEEFLINSGF